MNYFKWNCLYHTGISFCFSILTKSIWQNKQIWTYKFEKQMWNNKNALSCGKVLGQPKSFPKRYCLFLLRFTFLFSFSVLTSCLFIQYLFHYCDGYILWLEQFMALLKMFLFSFFCLPQHNTCLLCHLMTLLPLNSLSKLLV